jgi:hypothetical protein
MSNSLVVRDVNDSLTVYESNKQFPPTNTQYWWGGNVFITSFSELCNASYCGLFI